MKALRAGLVVSLLALVGLGCAVVPQNRRAHHADPLMQADDDRTERHKNEKLYDSREAAAGGSGRPAGGGCGCQ